MSRTVVDLNDEMIRQARVLTGLKKKVEIVNQALEAFVRQHQIRKSVLEMEGRVKWVGNLKQMRKDRKIDFSR